MMAITQRNCTTTDYLSDRLATRSGKTDTLGNLLETLAPLTSPALTGTPTSPTASPGTNTTQISTTAFVKEAIDTNQAQFVSSAVFTDFLTCQKTKLSAALAIADTTGTQTIDWSDSATTDYITLETAQSALALTIANAPSTPASLVLEMAMTSGGPCTVTVSGASAKVHASDAIIIPASGSVFLKIGVDGSGNVWWTFHENAAQFIIPGASSEDIVTINSDNTLSYITPAEARRIIDKATPATVTVGSSKTLNYSSHQGKILNCSAALSLTVDNKTKFDPWGQCEIYAGGGTVTMVATATVRRAGSDPLTIPQYGRAVLMRNSTADEYVLSGRLA